MCVLSEESLYCITSQIVLEAKRLLADKLDKVILYGSYARGDYDDASDIDIMVLAHVTEAEEKHVSAVLFELIYQLNWDYDTLISLSVRDSATFYRWLDDLPFYQNVIRDGVLLSA